MSKSQAALFGVPISWIAMVAAILGGSSLIPLFFFAGGGGYTSLGYALVPLMGLVLGPYGGFIAGLIGGLIAWAIMPAAVLGGPITVFLDWAMVPLIVGLIINKKWHIAVALQILAIVFYNVFPWYIPGPPTFATPAQPFYFLSGYWYYTGLILTLVTGRKIPEWIRSNDKLRVAISLIILEWASNEAMECMGWAWYAYLFFLPPDFVAFVSAFAVPWQRILTLIVVVGIGVPLLEGLKKSGLRKIPGSVWSLD